MAEQYSKELLDEKIAFEINRENGLKAEKRFFSLTPEFLRDKCHVLPSDSLEEARKKIMAVVKSDAFLYDYFKKDRRDWYIRGIDEGFWTTPTKVERVYTKEQLQSELGFSPEEVSKAVLPFKVSGLAEVYNSKFTVSFARKKPINVLTDDVFYEDYANAFEQFMSTSAQYVALLKKQIAGQLPKKKRLKYNPDLVMVIPDLELHLGKLASDFDSADSYDYKKALYRHELAYHDIEEQVELYRPKEIVMTVGNDYFNTDTEQNTTTAGTEQHNDTRFQQMLICGVRAHIDAIERMKRLCKKVTIKYMPGNHDFLVSFMLYTQLYIAYKDDPKVDIPFEVQDLRWCTMYRSGKNVFIFVHGKAPEGKAKSDKDLARLIYNPMFKDLIKPGDNVYVIAGHLHHASEYTAENGVTILRNGSYSGDGPWDSENMYISDKTHNYYLFDKERGKKATFAFTLTPEEQKKSIESTSSISGGSVMELIGESLAKARERIIKDMMVRQIESNKREIEEIEVRYDDIISRLQKAVANPDYSEDAKRRMMEIVGFNDEITPFVEENTMLRAKLEERGYQPTLKPGA